MGFLRGKFKTVYHTIRSVDVSFPNNLSHWRNNLADNNARFLFHLPNYNVFIMRLIYLDRLNNPRYTLLITMFTCFVCMYMNDWMYIISRSTSNDWNSQAPVKCSLDAQDNKQSSRQIAFCRIYLTCTSLRLICMVPTRKQKWIQRNHNYYLHSFCFSSNYAFWKLVYD